MIFLRFTFRSRLVFIPSIISKTKVELPGWPAEAAEYWRQNSDVIMLTIWKSIRDVNQRMDENIKERKTTENHISIRKEATPRRK